jgi:hypothetical protein
MSRKPKSPVPAGDDEFPEDDSPANDIAGDGDLLPVSASAAAPIDETSDEAGHDQQVAQEPAFRRRAQSMLAELNAARRTGAPEFEGVVPLRLPASIHPEHPVAKHLNVRLSDRQAWALRAIQEGADQARAILDSDRRVTTAATAVLYLLEQVADSIEQAATASNQGG